MSAKKTTLFLSIVVLLVLVMASVAHAELSPTLAVTSLFADITAGNVDEAVALFAEDAVITNGITGESHTGIAEIEETINTWYHPGRRFEVVAADEEGNTIRLHVECSDHGVVWPSQLMTADMRDEQIQSLRLDSMRLLYWPRVARIAGS